MKKAVLGLVLVITFSSLSACGLKNSVTSSPENSTSTEIQETTTEGNSAGEPEAPAEEDMSTDEETDAEASSDASEEDEAQQAVEISRLSADDAVEAYKEMAERFEHESPVDVYHDVLELLPRMPESYSSMLFAKFDAYMENWSLNYTDQIYFEDGPMKGLDMSLAAAYDYETDTYDFEKVENTTHKAILESLTQNGFKFIWLEGSPYPFVNYAQLKKLNESVPEEVMAFILVMSTESNEITAADAGLVIGWNELSRRIVQAENAMKIIDNETLYMKLESLYRFYCGAYLLGMNNTPVVDWESNKMLEAVLSSYEQSMSLYPQSQLATMLETYLSALSKMDYTLPYSDQEAFQGVVKIQSDLIENAVKNLHAHHNH